MNELKQMSINCPYCGQKIPVLLDPSDVNSAYTEDCQVCCQPIIMEVQISGDDDLDVLVRREDD